MTIRSLVEKLVLFLVITVALSLVASQALGVPILLSYVETGSMAPTLEPNDGFVAVPTELSGPVEEGDVVVFRAKEVQGGGLTTHRVVGQSERGYVTKGDANPVPDQASDEPPVKESQVVAIALTFDGEVVVIPQFGALVVAVQESISTAQRYIAAYTGTDAVLGGTGLAYLFFALSLLWYLAGEVREQGAKDRNRNDPRDGFDVRLILAGFTLLLMLGLTANMVLPAGSQEISFVSADYDSAGIRVIERGTTETATYSVQGGALPTVIFLQTDGKYIDAPSEAQHVGRYETVNSTISLSAPRKLGYYRQYITEYRYLSVLPLPILRSLYIVHPWLPIVVTDALVGIPFYLVGVALVGTGRLRERSRNRTLSLTTKLRRLLRSLY